MSADFKDKIEELERRNSILLKIQELTRDLVSTHDLDLLLMKITDAARGIVGSESATIFLLDKEKNDLYFRVALGEKGNQVSKFRLPLNDASIAGWVAVHNEPAIVNDTAKDSRHFKKIDQDVGYQTHNVLAVPVDFGDETLGVLEAVNKQGGEYNDEDRSNLAMLATQAAIAINNALLVEELRNFFINGIELLIDAMEAQSKQEKGHAFRVARLATTIARKLGITGKNYEHIYYAALLHNIGKVQPLSPTEDVRKHCIIGAELLSRIHLLRDIVPFVRHQYEHYDGSGFPDHLKGDKIPLGARILGLANEYEEKHGSSSDPEVIQNLINTHNGEFDPRLLEILPEVLAY